MELTAAELSPALVLPFAFVFGAAWGSFFNVCIYRWPRDMSVVSPPSSCPHCSAPVANRYNVPVFGWLLLRGKTACCGKPLSGRYALVEAMTGLLAVALAQRHIVHAAPGTAVLDGVLVTAAYFLFVGALIISTFVDLEFMEIPDEVTLPGAAFGLATATLRAPESVADFALGAGAGFLLVQLVFVWSYEHLAGRRGMGEGDAKLMLLIGAFLGWQGALFALVAGSMQGLLVAAFALLTGRELGPSGDFDELERARAEAAGIDPEELDDDEEDDEELEPAHFGHLKTPFGPFLALAALEFLFFGDRLLNWWVDLMV